MTAEQNRITELDETGARISGARWWFHVACTDWLTLLDCHGRRGVDAFADMAVLPFFSGVLVSDGWKPYWSVGTADHDSCCAHLLRDLASVAQVTTQGSFAFQRGPKSRSDQLQPPTASRIRSR